MQQLQVTVTDAKGAVQDPESIVSIRAASSRRQGAVQLKRALHFPVPMADATPFKVDVLRKIGEGEVSVRAEDDDYTCSLKQLGAAQGAMNLKLAVRCAPHLCGRTRQELKVGASAPLSTNVPEAPIKEPPAAISADLATSPAWPELQQGAAVQARQYFDNHNVMRLVQALLEALIRDQPQEPFSYIGTFMDRLSEALNQKPPVKAGDDIEDGASKGLDTCAVARQQNPEWTATFDLYQKQGMVGVDDFCTAIQSIHPHLTTEQARALCKGIARGDTGVNLAGFCAAANSVAEGDAMAAEVAGMSAAKFAELGTAASTDEAKDMMAVRAQMRSLLVDSLEDGRLERSLSANAFEKVREKAAAKLGQAAKDGTLEQALETIKKVPPPMENVPANPPPPSGPEPVLQTNTQEDLDETRKKVKAALVTACDDGRLHSTLRELWGLRQNKDVNQEELEKIRGKARDMLLESAANGRLHAELCSIKHGQQDASKQADEQKIHEKLRTLLIAAADDGRLEEAVNSVGSVIQSERQAEGKAKVRDVLSAASDSGCLDDAVKSIAAEKQAKDLEKMRGVLTAACDDGRLDDAVKSIAAEQQAKAASEKLEDLKRQASDTLTKAFYDGRLAGALETSKKARQGVQAGDFEQVRLKTKQMLTAAIEDGALEKALRESAVEPSGAEEGNDVADMVRDLLVGAALDGRLEESLNKMAEPTAKDEIQEDSAAKQSSDVGPLSMDFHFDRLLFCFIDEEAFKKEFLEALERAGARSDVLSPLLVTLREGSVIARVSGPDSSISVLRNLRLEGKVKVQGEIARIEEVESTEGDAGPFLDLQSRALNALVSASKDGSLQEVLASVRGEQRQATSPTDKLFDLIDTDKDNMISRAELKEALQNGTVSKLIAETAAPTEKTSEAAAAAPAETTSAVAADQATSRALPSEFLPEPDVRMSEKNEPDVEAKPAKPDKPDKPDKPAKADSNDALTGIKQKAKAALVNAATDGSLTRALSGARPQEPPAAASKFESNGSKQKTKDRMTLACDDEAAAVLALASASQDKYAQVRQIAGAALVRAAKDGRLDSACKEKSQPRRRSGSRLTIGLGVEQLAPQAASASTAPALVEAASSSAAPAAPAASSAQSSRHADLLVKQRELLEQKQAYEGLLAELKVKKGLVPVPPSTEKPSSKRPLGATVSYRDLKEVNSGLCQENARLNTEMARLLARLAESGK